MKWNEIVNLKNPTLPRVYVPEEGSSFNAARPHRTWGSLVLKWCKDFGDEGSEYQLMIDDGAMTRLEWYLDLSVVFARVAVIVRAAENGDEMPPYSWDGAFEFSWNAGKWMDDNQGGAK